MTGPSLQDGEGAQCGRLFSGQVSLSPSSRPLCGHVGRSATPPPPPLHLPSLPPPPPPQPSDSHVVVGMTNRLLSILRRPLQSSKGDDKGLPLSVPTAPRGGTYRYFVRGKKYKPTEVSLPGSAA